MQNFLATAEISAAIFVGTPSRLYRKTEEVLNCDGVQTANREWINELLSLPSQVAELLFAQFLLAFNHINVRAAAIRTELQMLDDELTITYSWKVGKSL